MSHRLRMVIIPAVLVCVLALTLTTGFAAVGVTSAVTRTGVATPVGDVQALPTSSRTPPRWRAPLICASSGADPATILQAVSGRVG